MDKQNFELIITAKRKGMIIRGLTALDRTAQLKKTKSRFMASAKLSDYLIKRVIRLYAEGISASEAASQLHISYPTIRNIYHLVRSRMHHLSLYPSEEDYREYKEAWSIEAAEIDRHLEEIMLGIWRRRGVNDATRHLHMAELL
ncbi:helix-turn-helix domain-containing protein [Brucella pituitosa]|uniref:helix-turn-helix domain-containing protein n=1 Tax=Brucella pituitosa TaxID=571256 RepID=UPI00200525E9|nr:helix-turn-helix domain-containing protein [Brucella pituitosa]MCK4207538.1 helix-turn-helix domain-containing protein [Brucella pituitosa]